MSKVPAEGSLGPLLTVQQVFKDRFAKEKFSFGLDIGTSTVKMVKLKRTKDATELVGFEVEPAQVDLTPVLAKMIQSLAAHKVNIGLSGPSTIIRYAPFAKLSKVELAQSLKFEAQKHIPFSVSEVNLDAHILSDLPDTKMMVLLAAVKKDFLAQRVKLIEDAGVKVRLVDVDSLAMTNCFLYNYGDDPGVKDATAALLTIGTALSSVNIVERCLPRLSRDIHVAGNHITQKLGDLCGLDFKAAEEVKRVSAPEHAEKITAAMDAVLVNLAREVRISFDYFESQSSAAVSKIYLSGSGSQVKGFKEMLAGIIDLPVEVWDPLRKIIISAGIDTQKLANVASQLPVAVGLALRN